MSDTRTASVAPRTERRGRPTPAPLTMTSERWAAMRSVAIDRTAPGSPERAAVLRTWSGYHG